MLSVSHSAFLGIKQCPAPIALDRVFPVGGVEQ